MSASCDISSTLPQESTEDVNDREPAFTAPGSAPPDGTFFASPQEKVSSSALDVLWCKAFEHYGLQRPTDAAEIHVFRVLLQSSWDKNTCTRSVTRTCPLSDPFQTLERIIDEWSDLEIEEHNQSWRLSPVNTACTWSTTDELSSPAYVLTRKGNPFHSLRPHGVLEVVWGHRQWTTAIALPKWINKYHCLGLFAQVCGPMLTPSCAIWCDDTRLCEELVECTIGSFVQVHIKACCSDLVRIDLQAALQRSIHTLHLPDRSLQDDLVQMKVFVPQGVTCFSGATFSCTSSFENWQTVLREEGRRIYPGRNPDNMIFHRVHQAIEEVCPIFEPAVKHFILADADEQEHTRTVVFAIFASRFEFFGACHWTRLPGCGIFWTCVVVRKGGSSITTIDGSDIKEFRFTRGTSLPVMSGVSAPPFCWRIIHRLILPKCGWLMPLCNSLVRRQDLPPRGPWEVHAVPEMMLPLLLKLRGTHCSS